MAEDTYTSADYTMGYSEEFRQMLNWRSAQSHAGYLLPHLASGQKLLDFGCGPGTITVGLARAVEPGEVHGIDMEESQIALARAAAAVPPSAIEEDSRKWRPVLRAFRGDALNLAASLGEEV